MAGPFIKVVVVYKPIDKCMSIAEKAAREFKQRGIEVFTLTVDDISTPRGTFFSGLEDADLVVSIGGDGTFMRSAKAFSRVSLILPYPCGRRNVYYEHELPEIGDVVESALGGSFYLEFLPMPSACHDQKCASFLNDLVVVSTDLGKVSKYTVEITSPLIRTTLTFEGDGVIVSTAGGSGGHNLSARGPLITPLLEALTVTPINPLQVGVTSMVIPAFANVSIKVRNRAYAYLDGDLFSVLERDDSVDLPGNLGYVKVIRLKPFRDLMRAVFESRRHIF
ncbi:MAG: NAD(+)/NADH kinase [Desulfurococcaceae archaeon]